MVLIYFVISRNRICDIKKQNIWYQTRWFYSKTAPHRIGNSGSKQWTNGFVVRFFSFFFFFFFFVVVDFFRYKFCLQIVFQSQRDNVTEITDTDDQSLVDVCFFTNSQLPSQCWINIVCQFVNIFRIMHADQAKFIAAFVLTCQAGTQRWNNNIST